MTRWMLVCSLAVLPLLNLTVAHAAPVNRCWQLDPQAETIPFALPEKVCIDDALVEWDFEQPTHHLTLKGTPFNGDFSLQDYGDVDDHTTLVEAMLLEKSQSVPQCFKKRAVALNFRFEVDYDAKTIYNSKIWVLYTEADDNCQSRKNVSIAYLPIN